jgi:hypothetical protein
LALDFEQESQFTSPARASDLPDRAGLHVGVAPGARVDRTRERWPFLEGRSAAFPVDARGSQDCRDEPASGPELRVPVFQLCRPPGRLPELTSKLAEGFPPPGEAGGHGRESAVSEEQCVSPRKDPAKQRPGYAEPRGGVMRQARS